MTAHERTALAQTLPRGSFRVIEQQIQRLPVTVGRYNARHDQQQTPQEDQKPLQNAEPQHAEKEAEAVKEVSELGLFVAADVQCEDHEADADHVAHDPQRDDERDRKAGHTVVLKEAEVRLLNRLRAEARSICQRRGQTIHAHQVRRERRDEHTEGKEDQPREDRARLTADGTAARIRLEHNAI